MTDDGPHVLALDHGTSGCKVALLSMQGAVRAWAFEPVPTALLPGGGAEQDPEAWWRAFVAAARRVMGQAGISADRVEAVAVSSTFSSTVAVDRDGRALMSCLTWLDSRGAPYVKAAVGAPRGKGTWPPGVMGYDAVKLLRWIRRTGGIPQLSGKDDIAHVLLVRHEHPAVYEQTHAFLGSKDYLTLRLTGEVAASYDSISLFWVSDIRDIHRVRYDDGLIRTLGIDREKLPPLRAATDVLGTLLPAAAEELGLPRTARVVAGSPDHQSALVGSGAVRDFEGHCYIGTSSWVECLVPYKKTDPFHSIASLPSAVPGRYQCIDEQDIAGGCLPFLVHNLLFPRNRLNPDPAPSEPYPLLDEVVATVPAGSRGVLFAPWLNGERTPVDSNVLRGGLYNLSLTTTAGDVARGVYEGVALNTRWAMGYVERFIRRPFDALTFVGGGARSDVWCQIFADVLDRPVKQSADPILANARGAAFIAAVGLGHLRFEDLPGLVRHKAVYEPNPAHRCLYDDLYAAFLGIYRQTRRLSARLSRR
jgi:xylulokinase